MSSRVTRSASFGDDTLEQGYKEINDTFSFFNENGRKLEKLRRETTQIFDRIEKELKNVSFQKSLAEHLMLESESKQVQKLQQNPSLIFVGQTKAGKSSLINELLGKSMVTSDQRPCTARLVKLAYGPDDHPKITILNSNDSVHTPAKLVDTAYVPTELVNLPYEDRDNKDVVQTSVLVEMNHPLLKVGVNIIDSPGRNENKTLDNLVSQQMDSILPLIIYVIDGRNCLTSPDIQDIESILEKTSASNVFFVVNKIDPPKKERRVSTDSDETDSEDSEDSESEDEAEQEKQILIRENDIKTKIFNKLVSLQFINSDYKERMDDCPNFHALSSWEVKKYRRAKTADPATANKTRYVDKFYRFQHCLKKYIDRQLRQCVKQASDGVLQSHKRCLDFFIQTANDISKKKRSVETDMIRFKDEEEQIHKNVITAIKNRASSFEKRLQDMLKVKSNDIIRAVGQHEYQEDELKINLPKDEEEKIKDSDVIKKFEERISEVTQRKLSDEITRLLVEEFGKDDRSLAQLAEDVECLEAGEGTMGTARVLKETLIKAYNFDLTKQEFVRNFLQKAVQALKRFFATIAWLFSGSVPVRAATWKEKIASQTLSKIDKKQLTKLVLNEIEDHVEVGHSKFLEELNNLEIVYQTNSKMSDAERKQLRERAPQVARLQLYALDLNDRFTYPKIDQWEVLGKGAQGVVYTTSVRSPSNQECAVKVVKYQGDKELGDLALEIHYTRQFKHKNIMPLYASLVEDTKCELQLLSPRMDGDLLDVLPDIQGLKDKLFIALQTAEAIKYLHDNDMIHRDIKASNILIKKENGKYRALLTDFGLMKPLGIQNHSFVGTPVHIAPEIVRSEHYDTSVDVFSLGILLWYICEGSGSNHPEYVQYCAGVGPVLMVSALGQRPERKPYFVEDCWRLMERCWDNSPVQRPTATEIIRELKSICAKPLPMR